MTDVLDSLNNRQRAAAEATDGPVVIVAGPGTGKTKTLTARIAYLIASGKAAPAEVLALTFTNKAAREIQARLVGLLPTGNKNVPTVSTFHGLAQKVLGEPGGTLLAGPMHTELLQTVKKQVGAKQPVRDIGLLISRAKNQLEPPADTTVQSLVTAYNSALATHNMYDFDDLLLQFHTHLKQAGGGQQYRYILVDEFQDTNELQFSLLKLLNASDNLFVIGDPLQSIYGFRGASAAVFDRFIEKWPSATCITLVTNYRSAAPIVQAANAVFPGKLQLQPYRHTPGKVQILETLNEYGEADWVVNEIERQVGGSTMLRSSKHHMADQQQTFKDFAVLYRTHRVARTVQQALEASGIPYQVAGEGSPYGQPHIQALVAALAYTAGHAPPPSYKDITSRQMEMLLHPFVGSAEPLPRLVAALIECLGLAADKHVASLRQFTNGLVPFAGKSLSSYLNHVQSIAEQEYYDPAADAVTLLTIHAAKGLEFSRVFLLAAEDGVLPHIPKKLASPENTGEERRLFFVAITRARDELYILHTRKRARQPRQLSRFACSLPPIAVRSVDPCLPSQQRKITKRHQKRSQTSLF